MKKLLFILPLLVALDGLGQGFTFRDPAFIRHAPAGGGGGGGDGSVAGPPGFGNIGTNYAAANSTTISVTNAAITDSNLLAMCFILQYNTTITSVTNSAGQSYALKSINNASLVERGYVYVLTNPPATSHWTKVTFAGAAAQSSAIVMLLTNALGGFGPIVTNYNASGSATMTDSVSSATNQLVTGFLQTDKDTGTEKTPAYLTGQTQRGKTWNGAAEQETWVFTQPILAGSTTTNVSGYANSGSGVAQAWNLICVTGY
jgi:hypothetical protein